jgi:hypothetical protein
MKRLMEKTVFRVGDGLALGDLADEALAVLGESDDRRGGPAALRVGDDDGVASLHDCTTELVVPRSMPITLSAIRSSGRYLGALLIAVVVRRGENLPSRTARVGPEIRAEMADCGVRSSWAT